jgi:hypothetical protein
LAQREVVIPTQHQAFDAGDDLIEIRLILVDALAEVEGAIAHHGVIDEQRHAVRIDDVRQIGVEESGTGRDQQLSRDGCSLGDLLGA